MSSDLPTQTVPRRSRRASFGFTGVLIGLLAIASAICITVIEDRRESERHRDSPLITVNIDGLNVVESTKKAWTSVKGKFSKETPATHPASASPALQTSKPFDPRWISPSIGFVAMCCGVAGLLRHESTRPALAAVSLGLIAVGWQWVMYAILVAVVILILGILGGT